MVSICTITSIFAEFTKCDIFVFKICTETRKRACSQVVHIFLIPWFHNSPEFSFSIVRSRYRISLLIIKKSNSIKHVVWESTHSKNVFFSAINAIAWFFGEKKSLQIVKCPSKSNKIVCICLVTLISADLEKRGIFGFTIFNRITPQIVFKGGMQYPGTCILLFNSSYVESRRNRYWISLLIRKLSSSVENAVWRCTHS